MEDKEIYINIARLDERLKNYMENFSEFKSLLGDLDGRCTKISHKLEEVEKRIDRLFLIDLKKILIAFVSICLVGAITSVMTTYINNKLGSKEVLKLEITEEEQINGQ